MGKTFVKITNEDIFKRLEEMDRNNIKCHEQIITRQDKTNGNVKLAKWIATTGVTISLIVIGFLFNHLRGV